MSVGYYDTLVDPSPQWYLLFNEIGKDTTLNTPTSFPYGGNTDGGASEIYSETMGDIFSYASGCQLVSNAASYGIGPDVTADIQSSMLAGAANLQTQFNQYVTNGATYTSWNPGGGPDPTLGTVATLAWKFIVHAETNGQGYQIPATRLMTFCSSLINPCWTAILRGATVPRQKLFARLSWSLRFPTRFRKTFEVSSKV